MPSVLDSLRIRAYPALNDKHEPPRVRYGALTAYYKLLSHSLRSPATRLLPVLTAYAAHLDQFLRMIETPGEHPVLKRTALNLSIHCPFLNLNAAVQRQETPELRHDVQHMIQQEVDIPIVMERLMQICENKEEIPAVRIQALKAFQAVSRTSYASLQPDIPPDAYTDRMTALALKNDDRTVSRQIITLGLI